MLPIHQIESQYRNGAHGHTNTFRDDLRTHQYTGHILDTPEYFFMWRMVGLDWPLDKMRDCSQFDSAGICAFIWCAAGDWRAAAAEALLVTPQAQYAAYERRGMPRLLEISEIRLI